MTSPTQTYVSHVLAQTPRLLSMLDREPLSPTRGSFDRDHWSWKFRDFPLGMLQSAVYPLALLWQNGFPGNPYHRNPRLLEWIFAGIDQAVARQHANGAIDGFAPNEQNPGITLAVLHGPLEAYRLVRSQAPCDLEQRFLTAVRKGCDFALRFEQPENHAFVSNHWGMFAVACLDAHELLSSPELRARAERYVDRILREQSPDGWYREYNGPDPGYESLGIFHLAMYWKRTGREDLLRSLKRAVEFHAHCVHPDGSVGGNYGSRHTSLYYPGGFEILGSAIPLARAVARFLAPRLSRGNVVTPASCDAENLPSLAYAYLEAALAAQGESDPAMRLPCETLEGRRHFPDSGIVAAGARRYYAVMQTKRGGVCRVFDRRRELLAYEDAGYVICVAGRWWTSQMAGVGESRAGDDHIECRTEFCQALPLVPGPASFILLRLLNLTLFRSPRLANWVRRRVVNRLILRRKRGPIRLTRTLRLFPDGISFADRLELARPLEIDSVALARAFTGIHMGSARYFHENELVSLPSCDTRGMARELKATREARVEFHVTFSEGEPAEITSGLAALPVSSEELVKR